MCHHSGRFQEGCTLLLQPLLVLLRIAALPRFATLRGKRHTVPRDAADCGPSSVCYTLNGDATAVLRAADCGPSSVCYTLNAGSIQPFCAADCGSSSVCYTDPGYGSAIEWAADCGPSSVCYTCRRPQPAPPGRCGLRPFLGLLHSCGGWCISP